MEVYHMQVLAVLLNNFDIPVRGSHNNRFMHITLGLT